MSYVDIFGGEPVTPAKTSYQRIETAVNVSLVWPDFRGEELYVFADVIEAVTAGAGLKVALPDASQAGVGISTVLSNLGTDNIEVVDFDGASVAVLAPGVTHFIYLQVNTTPGGVWKNFTLGTGTSAADAALLAGFGLVALTGRLNQSFPVTETASASVAVTTASRATLFVLTGGSQTLDLLSLATAGNNFFFAYHNSGSGVITIDPAGTDTVDGQATLQANPGDAGIVVAGTSGWFTVGVGRSNTFLFTKLTKSVAGNSNVVLTASESANQLLEFNGLLTGNITVTVPAVPAVYYTYNHTTGGFTLSLKTPTSAPVAVTQGFRAILVCDGSTLVPAEESLFVLPISIPDGNVGAPGIALTSDPDTGLYKYGPNAIAVSSGGARAINFGPNEVSSTFPYRAPDGALALPAYAFAGEQNSGWYRAGAGDLRLSELGVDVAKFVGGVATIPNLYYLPSGTDAVSTTVQTELDRHIVSSLRFMSEVQRNDVLGDIGSVDVSSPIQKWLDYLMTNKATGILVNGKHLHSQTLMVESGDITIKGQGPNARLIRTGDFGDSIFVKGTAGAYIQRVNIYDILIESLGLTTSGALIHLDGLQFGEFRGLDLRQGFNQILCEGATQIRFRSIYGTTSSLFGGTATGRIPCRFKESSGNSPNLTNSAIYMSDYNFSGSSSVALFDYAMSIERTSDGHFMSNGHVGGAGVANLLLDERNTSAGIQLSLIFFSNFMSDKCFGAGIIFRGGTDSGINGHTIMFSNVNIRGGVTGTVGIHAESTANFSGVAFANLQVNQFSKQAMLVESPLFRHSSIVNPMFQDNSLSATATTAGAFVVGETYRILTIGTTDFTLIGATANTVGLLFTATGAGVGSGTAALTYTQVEFGAACGYGSFTGGRVGGKTSAGGVSQSKSAFKFNASSLNVSVQGVKCNLNAGDLAFEGTGDGTILIDNPFLDESENYTLTVASTTTIPLGRDFAILQGAGNVDNLTIRPTEAGVLTLRVAGGITIKNFTTVAAGAFVPGTIYTIRTVGTTDFTLIGAASNTIGVTFTATGIGAGSGTADAGNIDIGADYAGGAGKSISLICDNRSVIKKWYKISST